MSQIDLVPTFSLLLGIPIPFGNLGTIIPELFCHDPTLDSLVLSNSNTKNHALLQQVLGLLQRNTAFELNAKQVYRYLTRYTSISGEIPKSTFQELEEILQNAIAYISKANTFLNKFGRHKEMIEKASTDDLLYLQEALANAESLFLGYLSRAKALCQSLWAKFDLNSIFAGISVLFIGIAVVVIALLDRGVRLSLMAFIPFMGLGLASVVTSFSFDFIFVFPSFAVCGLILGIFVLSWRKMVKKTEGTVTSFLCKLSLDSILALALCFLQCVALFSNSFVVNEDKIVAFFIQALVTVKCVQILWKSGLCENRKPPVRQTSKKPGKKDNKKASMNGFLVKLFFAWIAFELVNRTALALKACREEQWYCEPSDFLKPLSALTENAASNRFFLTVLCTGVMPLLIWQWLRHQGNLNGPSFVVLCVKFTLPAAFVLMWVHWASQIVPQEMNSVFPEVNLWQQIVLPQMVYCLCFAAIAGLVYSPLCIYTVFRSRRHTFNETVNSLQSTDDSSKIIHALVREIKQSWDSLNGSKTQVEDGERDDENTPMVYGLATVYSSALLVVFLAVSLPLMLLLGNGMSLSVVLMFVQMFLLLELHGLHQDVESGGSDISPSG